MAGEAAAVRPPGRAGPARPAALPWALPGNACSRDRTRGEVLLRSSVAQPQLGCVSCSVDGGGSFCFLLSSNGS